MLDKYFLHAILPDSMEIITAGEFMQADMVWVFILRLAVAGLLGAAVGFEREYRAKEAGTRTHFLVAMGSCLLMIVSQWGFQDILTMTGSGVDMRLDASRVASQIVSGIGFIGAGTIMMQKQVVHGLTTAAGMWAVAGIGMAVGGGMYVLGAAATVLALVGLEVLRFLGRKIHSRSTYVVFLVRNRGELIHFIEELDANSFQILNYMVYSEKSGMDEYLRVKMWLRDRSPRGKNQVLLFIQKFPEIEVEKVE